MRLGLRVPQRIYSARADGLDPDRRERELDRLNSPDTRDGALHQLAMLDIPAIPSGTPGEQRESDRTRASAFDGRDDIGGESGSTILRRTVIPLLEAPRNAPTINADRVVVNPDDEVGIANCSADPLIALWRFDRPIGESTADAR